MKPIITLTTDFGQGGYYVGAMRGVLLAECPGAVLADITHHVTPFAPLEGSFILDQATEPFPPGTVHLAVVDPGVGGIRKPVFLHARGHWFVGPDNGLFTPFADRAEAIYRIREDVVVRPGRSRTFDGRDVFAPTAARLARGDDPETFGEPTQQIVRLHLPRPRWEGDTLIGQILFQDHFGNLITNIRSTDLTAFHGAMEVWVGTYRMRSLFGTYEEAGLGETIALVGSSGHLEVAVAQGNAAAHLGVGRGERVRVRPPAAS